MFNLQIYNLPKLFNIEFGGDVRVFVMDNHRPFHLANVYSRHNVVLFDDIENVDNDNDDIPSDGSELSAVESVAEADADAAEADAEASDILRHSGHPVLGGDGDGQDRVPPSRDREGVLVRVLAIEQWPPVLVLGAFNDAELGNGRQVRAGEDIDGVEGRI